MILLFIKIEKEIFDVINRSMYTPLKIVSIIFFIALFGIADAQFTKINDDPDARFKMAKELYQEERYSLAYPIFKDLYYNGISKSNIPVTIQTEAKYYYIICGLKVNDVTVPPLAIGFINLEHHTPRIEMLSFQLGEYFYRNKDFVNAITYYEKSVIDNLNNDEIADLKFHQGYCYFTLQQFNEAKPLLDVVRQMPKYANYIDANYYYGFISFSEQNYDDALPAFNIAVTSETYKKIVPFYIAEIYYFKGDHELSLKYAEAAIQSGGQYYDLQLKQLAGHLWFDKKEYNKAQPYLEEFIKKNDKVTREDLYELSYCYYAEGNWNKSIEGFKQLGGKEDSLAQNSMYLLATAYLKTNQKANARNAFLFCSSNNSNPLQKEISLFNYAKLSYELGLMDIALHELQNFIAAYPTSDYLQEAKELQISVLSTTSNYKDALVLFESLPTQSVSIKKIYSTILYGRAVELINDQRIDKADELLNKIIQDQYNASLLQLVYFWKGEIAYRNGNISEAINYFANYLNNPQVNGEVNSINAKYSLAYCLLKTEQYATALQYFQQIVKNISFNTSLIEVDAYIRTADCYFMEKDYKKALTIYDNVIALNVRGADYALFQKAIIAGAANKNAEKIDLLQSIGKRFPSSNLLPDVNMEIANTYMAQENFDEAIIPLQQILQDTSATALWPKAYLKLGVANFNLNKNETSLNNFTQLVAKYPNSQESDEAIEYIRNIFVTNQRPSDFIAFMKQNGKPITYSEEDSLTFRSAQLKYDERDFANAQIGYTNYLSKFSDGKYAIEANYFLAEINIVNKNFNAALPFYNAVAAKAPNKYAERSSLQSARIYYFNLKDFVNAEKYYLQLTSLATQQENRLEAMRGLLRCQYKLKQWKDAVANAQALLQEKTAATDDKMMATMCIAKSLQLDEQLDAAITSYQQVIDLGKSEFSAEAQYQIAEILLQQNKFKNAEKAGFEVIKNYGSYDYWVTKSYILLGDVYFKQNDFFNAEATFKSVAENAANNDLKMEAQKKLDIVLDEKLKNSKVNQQ